MKSKEEILKHIKEIEEGILNSGRTYLPTHLMERRKALKWVLE